MDWYRSPRTVTIPTEQSRFSAQRALPCACGVVGGAKSARVLRYMSAARKDKLGQDEQEQLPLAQVLINAKSACNAWRALPDQRDRERLAPRLLEPASFFCTSRARI